MKQNQSFFQGTSSNMTSYIFLSKNNKVFGWLSKSKHLSFITKVNADKGNEKKSPAFLGTYLNLTSFFIGRKKLKYFNNFYNEQLSISLQQ